jgi:uncharacterized Zn-finger protein
MSFKAHGHLKDHMKRHLNLRPYECQICKAKFSRSSTLKIHSHIHTNKSEDKETIPTLNDAQPEMETQSQEKSFSIADNGNYLILMNYLSSVRTTNQQMYNMIYNNYLLNTLGNGILFNPRLVNQQQVLNYMVNFNQL